MGRRAAPAASNGSEEPNKSIFHLILWGIEAPNRGQPIQSRFSINVVRFTLKIRQIAAFDIP